MDCREFLIQIGNWEVTGALEAKKLHELQSHAAGCKVCSQNYSAILPFLEHDAGTGSALLQEAAPGFHSVLEQVMARIPQKRAPVLRLKWLSVAAALLLIVGGAFLLLPRLGNIFTSDEILVQFELKSTEAHSVYLVGDFSGWDPLKIPLNDADHDGVWRVKIPLRKDHSYTYNFIIDQERWIPDPEADLTVDDGFGGSNSMINL